MEYMRTLPDKSFDVIVADPPYNIGKAEWDKWPSVEAYVADVMTWLREFSRLLKDTGSLWMFHSDMAQFSRILAQSQHEPGLILRDFVVLYKRNFRAKSWRTVYEPLGFRSYEELRQSYEELRQSYEELRNYWRCDDNHCNVWEQTNAFKDAAGWHLTQKPPALYSRILKMSCPPGGRVFDPFLGSGSSRIAAYDLGLDFVGCELDPVYYKLEEERFARHSQQLNLFID